MKDEEGGDFVYDYFTFNMDELVYGDGAGYAQTYMTDKKPGDYMDSDHDS